MTLRLTTRSRGRATVVELHGELDAHLVSTLVDGFAPLRDKGRPVLIDLSAAALRSPSALDRLLGELERSPGGPVAVVCARLTGRRLLRVLCNATTRTAGVYQDVDSALEALGATDPSPEDEVVGGGHARHLAIGVLRGLVPGESVASGSPLPA